MIDEQGHRLAVLLAAITQLEDTKAEEMADYNLRIKNLKAEAHQLGKDILSGQGSLLDQATESVIRHEVENHQ